MRAVPAKDTKPEMVVRSIAHAMGLRFRLHRKDLPGNPDLVFPKYKSVVFVHGCFWHWHGCPRSRMPKSNIEYWEKKIDGNRKRDRKNIAQLSSLGWKSLIIWECETKTLSTFNFVSHSSLTAINVPDMF